MAPMAADIANSPVWSQKPSAYCGTQSRKSTRAATPMRLTSRPRSDTGETPGSEESGRAPQENGKQHDVRRAPGRAPPEECQLVLIPRREGRDEADGEPAHDRPGRGVQPPEHRRGDRGEGEQARRVADARGRE